MSGRDIVVVYGTRPEAIKLFILIGLLGRRARVIHTGQHYDTDLADNVDADLGLPPPGTELRIGGLRRGQQLGRATAALSDLLHRDPPAVVVVQGDTNTALAGALAANAEAIPLVHVEAGLRSFDRLMPEEHNRVLIDHLADTCAAPTAGAMANLANEAIHPSRTALTGNTIVEAVHRLVPGASDRATIRAAHGLPAQGYVLATFHRPENVDTPASLRQVLAGLAASPLPVVLPLHPRTAARIQEFGLESMLDGVRTLRPQSPRSFLALAHDAALVISDSGGVQEEATVLGTQVLVVRRSTERPEALGRHTELLAPSQLAGALRERAGSVSDRPPVGGVGTSPFGDGRASERIRDLVIGIADG